jgi:hypothetical protein
MLLGGPVGDARSQEGGWVGVFSRISEVVAMAVSAVEGLCLEVVVPSGDAVAEMEKGLGAVGIKQAIQQCKEKDAPRGRVLTVQVHEAWRNR